MLLHARWTALVRPWCQPYMQQRLFQSPSSTDHLYPGTSSLDRFKSPDPPSGADNEPAFGGFIPVDQLKVTYALSSGPGGQAVNKVATKVDIRFHFDSATWLSAATKATIRPKLTPHLTKDGFLVVRSDRTRSQMYNQADALRKLREFLWECLESQKKPVVDAEEEEIRRKQKLKAARERVKEKRARSIVKRDRAGLDW